MTLTLTFIVDNDLDLDIYCWQWPSPWHLSLTMILTLTFSLTLTVTLTFNIDNDLEIDIFLKMTLTLLCSVMNDLDLDLESIYEDTINYQEYSSLTISCSFKLKVSFLTSSFQLFKCYLSREKPRLQIFWICRFIWLVSAVDCVFEMIKSGFLLYYAAIGWPAAVYNSVFRIRIRYFFYPRIRIRI